VSQVGRPMTEPTPGIRQHRVFRRLEAARAVASGIHKSKEELIAAMNRAVEKYPGAIWNFSQPIEDNVGETLTGTKGSLALKIFGDDLKLSKRRRRSH